MTPRRTLIIGPDPETPVAGGVITHIRSLRNLDVFEGADLVDIGQVYGALSPRGIAAIVRNLYALRKRILAERYEAVIVNASIYDFSLIKLYLTLLAVPASVRSVFVFFHGGLFEELTLFQAAVVRASVRPQFRRITRSYFLSERQEAGFRALFPACPTARFSTFSSEAEPLPPTSETGRRSLRLLYTGRVVREKGVFELVAAAERLVAEGRDVEVVVAGDGAALPELRAEAADALGDRAVCLGFVTGADLEAAYLGADVMALPTYHPEGLPYSVIEGMRAGLPIVCSEAGALAQVVEEGVNGLRVPPRDVEALTDAFRTLYDDRALVRQMAENNRRHFRERLSRQAAEAFYQAVLQ